MKKIVTIGIGCLLSLSLSGCSLGSVIDRFTASDDAAIQDINPEITRVYMDEIRGELQNFTGNQITLLSDNESYTFDISQATLECSNGMLAGDAVSVVYEGQLDSTDTGAVHALKVVDDYHQTATLEDQTFRGQIQVLTANSITVKSDKNQTVTFPVTGTEQYYQAGIKPGNWVYIHYKGNIVASADGNTATADGSHTKTCSVSDIDPFDVPAPTPTPAPQEGTEVKKDNKLRAVIQSIQTNVLQVSIENTTNVLNLDMSALPCYFKGGAEAGSHVNIIYTGDFNGTTLDGISVLGITGENPDKLTERGIGFTISGDIIASTANTITLRTYDGADITCNTEKATNSSSGGLLTGSSVKITFNPADSKETNIYTAIKIEDL